MKTTLTAYHKVRRWAMARMRDFFLKSFDEGNLVIQKKSSSLYYSLLVLVIISAVALVAFIFSGNPLIDVVIIGSGAVLLLGLMFLLRTGRFETTVNLTLAIVYLALCGTVFPGKDMNPLKVYNLLSMQLTVYVLAGLIANRAYQAFSLGGLSVVSQIALFYLRIVPWVHAERGPDGNTQIDGLVSSLLLIALATAVIVGIIRTVNGLYTTLAEEGSAIRAASNQMKLTLLELKEGLRIGDHLMNASRASDEAVKEIDGNLKGIAELVDRLSTDTRSTLEENNRLQEAAATMKSATESHESAVEETSSSLEEMNSNLQSVGRISEDKNAKARELATAAESGMRELAEAVRRIEALNASSNEILGIVGIISDISDRTNILSMNAAIQAARAGEHGKGFSVVSTEIRSLAESSAANAKRISEVIASNLGDIQAAVDLNRRTEEIFTDVHDEIAGMVGAMDEMNSAVQELLVGTKEILGSTALLREGSFQTAEAIRSSEEAISRVDRNLQSVGEQTAGILEGLQTIVENSTAIAAEVAKVARIGEMNVEQMGRVTAVLESEDA